mgnify:CR=1 FL=1
MPSSAPPSETGPQNPPLWIETDFDIWLTKQQPTHWVVSQGRLVNAADQPCSNNAGVPNGQSGGIFPSGGFFDCNDAGLDPGRVPPVVSVTAARPGLGAAEVEAAVAELTSGERARRVVVVGSEG